MALISESVDTLLVGLSPIRVVSDDIFNFLFKDGLSSQELLRISLVSFLEVFNILLKGVVIELVPFRGAKCSA